MVMCVPLRACQRDSLAQLATLLAVCDTLGGPPEQDPPVGSVGVKGGVKWSGVPGVGSPSERVGSCAPSSQSFADPPGRAAGAQRALAAESLFGFGCCWPEGVHNPGKLCTATSTSVGSVRVARIYVASDRILRSAGAFSCTRPDSGQSHPPTHPVRVTRDAGPPCT
ncbi:hypothetical protein ZHAS_00016514 [Anopheles sinensis]|uniref:Uncharacterized protein n=1 Tax=Anopheles sinensis TaxID=74873 RepID=A0A084WDU7_ANOSI|nr:hypothetical protein ZHAS_00016514 [Anopheles sinensis]